MREVPPASGDGRCESSEALPPSPRPAVSTHGLEKRFETKVAVEGLDLTVPPGVFFGFLGPNGAGKTTTIRMLSGLLAPTAGTVEVAGIDVLAEPVALKRRIGILPEEFETYERLTGDELVEFCGRIHGIAWDELERRRTALFELLDLSPEDSSRPISAYSQGMRKKVGLACALVHSPDVLFLDEPFNGVDAITSRNIRGALEALTRRGLTVFFSSHVLDVVQRLCDEVAIIHEGRLRARGDLAALREQLGLPGEATLEDVFIHVVGADAAGSRDLDWIG